MYRLGLSGFLHLPLATLIGLFVVGIVTAHPMERMDYWQKNYEELLPAADPRAARAHAIFAQVLQVAGRRPGVVPRIFIAKEDPLGIALPIAIPDGGIILSKRVLEICYRDPARGDDRLAFVLGHEIAHLLKDDFWHMKFFQALEASKAKESPSTKEELVEIRRLAKSTDQVWAKELQADEYGVVYASLAGFRTHAIITEDDTVNFFADWLRALDPQHLSRASADHPSPTQRAAVVKVRLKQILDKIEVFNLGLRFYQTEQYARAILAFQDFVQFFPSREVYHNLAASHHQLALYYHSLLQKDAAALPFQLSLTIDPVTRASLIPRRSADRLSHKSPTDLFAAHLAKAIEHYQTALSLDPAYALSHNNLGCALLLQGEVFKAIGTFQDALKALPDSPEALNNLGVAFVYAENMPRALEYLRKAHALAPTHDAALFNLGKIAYEAGQVTDAQGYWQAYVQLATAGPWAEVMRQKLPAITPPSPWPSPAQKMTERLMGLSVGYFEEEVPQDLGTPRELRLALEQEPFKMALYQTGIMTLSQDKEVLMVGTLETYRGTSGRGIAIGSPEQDLLSQYGRPSKVLRTTGGDSWSYESYGIAFQLRAGHVISWLLF